MFATKFFKLQQTKNNYLPQFLVYWNKIVTQYGNKKISFKYFKPVKNLCNDVVVVPLVLLQF